MESGRGPGGDAYVLPRHPSEVDRLDVQHFAFREAMGGNYLAPVRDPAGVLDVGCGTGQWAHELCGEFPEALVVGLDLAPGKPVAPANYRFVRGNLRQGLPFPDGRFDFVHQRLLISGVPVREWQGVVAELVRVTRPGGWVELVEAIPGMEPEGPATRHLYDLLRRLGRTAGLDTLGHVGASLDRYLQQAGAEAVQTRMLELPVGGWAGRLGAWLVCDFRSLFTRLAGVFQASYGLGEAECRELIAAMLEEFEELHPRIRARVALGRRPASTPGASGATGGAGGGAV